MKWPSLLLALILAAGVFGGGFWLGRKPSGSQSTASSRATSLPKLPAGMPKSAPDVRKSNYAITTLEQAEAGLRELERSSYSRRWEKCRDFARDIDPTLLAEFIPLAETISPAMMRSHGLRAALFTAWARVDLRGAMAAADKTVARQERINNVIGVFGVWTESDPDGAFEWAKQLPNGPLRQRALDAAIQRLAERDPATALELAQTLGQSSRNRGGSDVAIFNIWATQDPQAAMAKAVTQPVGWQRQQAINAVISRWAEQDPTTAAAHALAMTVGQARNEAISSVASSWGQRDLPTALAWVQQLPAGRVRDNAINVPSPINGPTPTRRPR
jgi:hypothetical protein